MDGTNVIACVREEVKVWMEREGRNRGKQRDDEADEDIREMVRLRADLL